MSTFLRWRRLPQLPRGKRAIGSVVFGIAIASRLVRWSQPGNFINGISVLCRAAFTKPLGTPVRASLRRRSSDVMTRETPPAVVPDMSLQEKVQDMFQAALASLPPEATAGVNPQVAIADARFGDYQCNNAMVIFKQQKRLPDAPAQWKSPRDVGEAIKGALPALAAEMLEEVSVAPQGFVTVKLQRAWLEEEVRRLYRSPIRFHTKTPQRIVIDFSSPNIAKEMHVGHLRSTILGDTIANLLEWLGHDVVRLNHVGDWGTQFGMLLEYMRREESLGPDMQGSELLVRDLQTFYRNSKIAFDKDKDFRKAAQANVVALQSGEPWARQAWQQICEASRTEFEAVYSRLGIRGLEERGESFYNPLIPLVLAELEELQLVEEDGGAKCIFTNVSKAPLIVQKADGGYGYDSTDCTAVLHRLREERADRVIYVIDNGQETHMRMVFDVAARAGWSQGKRLDFMGFGLVQGEDGKKFKTRSGDVVRLRDLLDEAAERAEVELRNRAGDNDLDAEQLSALQANAKRIGVAAVKYFDLRQNRNSDYRFSYNAMLDPKGNTAVYALYAYARIAALLRRSSHDATSLDVGALSLREPSERTLALRLLRFPEVLAQVEEDLLPSRLIDYVYGLAGDFTAFYTECPVVGSEAEVDRLALCEVTSRTLRVCLDILGIEPLDRL
mmetsp:Transcript_93225/g.263556  ORF Transcript_93225/g.263556 Transcript_93225/m.263556 type:complete len:671 (-) Transcript_93225:93-2105(-)